MLEKFILTHVYNDSMSVIKLIFNLWWTNKRNTNTIRGASDHINTWRGVNQVELFVICSTQTMWMVQSSKMEQIFNRCLGRKEKLTGVATDTCCLLFLVVSIMFKSKPYFISPFLQGRAPPLRLCWISPLVKLRLTTRTLSHCVWPQPLPRSSTDHRGRVETRWLSVLYFFIFPAYYPRLFGACESTTRPRNRALGRN